MFEGTHSGLNTEYTGCMAYTVKVSVITVGILHG
jgi:hypothetical protein